jgi:hypothetical protein
MTESIDKDDVILISKKSLRKELEKLSLITGLSLEERLINTGKMASLCKIERGDLSTYLPVNKNRACPYTSLKENCIKEKCQVWDETSEIDIYRSGCGLVNRSNRIKGCIGTR